MAGTHGTNATDGDTPAGLRRIAGMLYLGLRSRSSLRPRLRCCGPLARRKGLKKGEMQSVCEIWMKGLKAGKRAKFIQKLLTGGLPKSEIRNIWLWQSQTTPQSLEFQGAAAGTAALRGLGDMPSCRRPWGSGWTVWVGGSASPMIPGRNRLGLSRPFRPPDFGARVPSPMGWAEE